MTLAEFAQAFCPQPLAPWMVRFLDQCEAQRKERNMADTPRKISSMQAGLGPLDLALCRPSAKVGGDTPRTSPAFAREPIDTSKLGPIKIINPVSPFAVSHAQAAAARRLKADLHGMTFSMRTPWSQDSRKLALDPGEAEAIVALAVRRLVKGDLS